MLYERPLHEPAENNFAVAAKVEDLVARGALEQAFIAFHSSPFWAESRAGEPRRAL